MICYSESEEKVLTSDLFPLRYRFMAMDRLGSDLQKVCECNGGRLKKATVLQLGQGLVRSSKGRLFLVVVGYSWSSSSSGRKHRVKGHRQTLVLLHTVNRKYLWHCIIVTVDFVCTCYVFGLCQVSVLEYIHENEYVHADIKAANLMLGYRDPEQVSPLYTSTNCPACA